jgi:hypothetical protein
MCVINGGFNIVVTAEPFHFLGPVICGQKPLIKMGVLILVVTGDYQGTEDCDFMMSYFGTASRK